MADNAEGSCAPADRWSNVGRSRTSTKSPVNVRRIAELDHDKRRTVGIYIRRPVGYADQFLVRQAASVDGARLVALLTPKMEFAGDVLFDANSVSYRLRARITGVLRRRGLTTGLDPFSTRRLSAAFADVRTMYTMFLDNGRDLATLIEPGRRRLVVHAAGSDVTTLGAMEPGIRRASLRAATRADVVLCGSEFIRDRLAEWISASNLVVHYIGVPVAEHVRLERPSPFTVVAVSRLHPVKGVHQSIEAFGRALREMKDAQMLVLGDGSERQALEALVQRLGLREHVRFLGTVPPTEVEEHLDRAHVLVQHNLPLGNGAAEALGGSLLEAPARGVPVVASRSGGVAEAVLDERTGLLVEPGDVDGMAAALLRLHGSESLRRRLGAEGHRHVRLTHNAAKQDRRLADILLER